MRKFISLMLPFVAVFFLLSCDKKDDPDVTKETNRTTEQKEPTGPCNGNYFRKGFGDAKYFIENLPESQGRVWVRGEKHTFEITPGRTEENYLTLGDVDAWAKDWDGNSLKCASASDGGDGIVIVCFGCGGESKVILKFSKK